MAEWSFRYQDAVRELLGDLPTHPLIMPPDAEPGALDGNLLVAGDNLLALAAMLPRYEGRVGVAIIDPPYNTGNPGWQYDDARWRRAGAGDDNDHRSWCATLWPRVALIHRLLSDDGVLLVHIDEHEVERASLMIDAIFGAGSSGSHARNRLGNMVWDKGNPKGDARGLAYQHEMIIIAAKDREKALARRPFSRPKPNAAAMLSAAERFWRRLGTTRPPEDLAEVVRRYDLPVDLDAYTRPYDAARAASDYRTWVRSQQGLSGGERAYDRLDSEGRPYRLVHMGWPNKKQAPDDYFSPIAHPLTGELCPIPARGWRYPSSTLEALLGDGPLIHEPLGRLRQGEVVFGPDASTQPQRRYLLEAYGHENIPSIVRFGGSDDSLLTSMGITFENPKPHQLTAQLLQWFSRPDDLVLDCYAGSGTTGHAVLLVNARDGGNRRFLLVQRDEGPGRASAEGTTARRLRCAIDGWTGPDGLHQGLGGAFTLCALGE